MAECPVAESFAFDGCQLIYRRKEGNVPRGVFWRAGVEGGVANSMVMAKEGQ
jgi:hypothetical protein